MGNIEHKIVRADREWVRYRYERAGFREICRLFAGAVIRRAGSRYNRIAQTLRYSLGRRVFKPSYDSRKENIVVSLTSIPDRLSHITPTLNSLICQTKKPDLIVLWLGKDMKYPEDTVSRIRDMGITVYFRDDLGAFTKYYYVFAEYKEDIVITVDDDILYHKDMIKELYAAYLMQKDSVIARRVHKIRFDADRKLMDYNDWILKYTGSDSPSHELFATGVGGVLYPPAVMSRECWEGKDFLTICPQSDDIWLKFYELLEDIRVCAVKDSRYMKDVINQKSQKINLSDENVAGRRNDILLRACMEHFDMTGDLCERVLASDDR